MLANWDQKIHECWKSVSRQSAIEDLERLLIDSQPAPIGYFLQYAYYCFLDNKYADASKALTAGLKLYPNSSDILLNLGVCQRRAGDHANAVITLERYTSIKPNDPVGFDGLCAAYSYLRRFGDAQNAGERSLCLKDSACLPLTSPLAISSDEHCGQLANVISFSLFGGNPRYMRGAVANVIESKRFFGNWKIRFYLDESVPSEMVDYLDEAGAEIIVESGATELRDKLAWRFKVANDPAVNRFLVRDVDSVVSQREVLAVEEWIKSGRNFHVMRDWWTHTDLILAGMWGGRAGVLPDLMESLSTYRPPHLETPNVDQWFLRDKVWPLIKGDVLIHDRFFRVLNSLPWPGPTPGGNVHVGQDVYTAHGDQQANKLCAALYNYPHVLACLGLK